MSLLLWYPYTEDKHNQGTLQLPKANLTFGDTSFEDGGKIGLKCANGRLGYHLDEEILGNEWTVATWIKSVGSLAPTSGNAIIFCKNHATATDVQIYFSFKDTNKLNVGVNGDNDIITVDTTCVSNTWYHVAATYKKPILSLYLNGQLVGSKTVYTTYQDQPEGRLNIMINGRSNNETCTARGGQWSDFRYNDFRLYDECLSKSQIKELSQGLVLHYKFDDPNPNMIDNINLYKPSNYLAYIYNLTENLIEGETYTIQLWNVDIYGPQADQDGSIVCYWGNGSGGSLCRWDGLENNSGHADYLVNTFTVKNYTDGLTRGPTLRIYNLLSQSNNTGKMTIGAIKLEKGNTTTSWTKSKDFIIVDSSGYNNYGIASGDLRFVDNALYVPYGKTDHIYTSNELGNFSEGITSNIWFKSLDNSNSHILLSHGNGSTNYEIRVLDTGQVSAGLKIGSEDQRDVASSPAGTSYLDGQWHMFTLVYDNTYISRYADGILFNQTTRTGGIHTPTFGLCFGAYGKLSGSSMCAQQAYLKDARTYSTALSAEDVAQLYNNVAKMDKENNLQTRQLIEKEENNLLKTPWTKIYTVHSVDPCHKFLNYDKIPQFIDRMSCTSDYIEVEPGIFYWDIIVSIDAGNHFYFGIERYDANKTNTSNQGTIYFIDMAPSANVVQQRYSGKIELLTAFNGNPLKYIALRILNGWYNTPGTATVHSLSLRQYSENTSVDRFGQLSNDWFIEEDGNIQRYKNGVLRANHFVER